MISNKERIQNTVVSYWSDEDEVYVAESAMMPHVVIGIGRTRDEAIKDFSKALDNALEDIEKDNVAGYKVGRPAKGYVQFNTNIRPTSKRRIAEISDELSISHGEVVDYLVFFRDCKFPEGDMVPIQSNFLSGTSSAQGQAMAGFTVVIQGVSHQGLDQEGIAEMVRAAMGAAVPPQGSPGAHVPLMTPAGVSVQANGFSLPVPNIQRQEIPA